MKQIKFIWPWTKSKTRTDLKELKKQNKIRILTWKRIIFFFGFPLLFAQIWNFFHWLIPGVVPVSSKGLMPNIPDLITPTAKAIVDTGGAIGPAIQTASTFLTGLITALPTLAFIGVGILGGSFLFKVINTVGRGGSTITRTQTPTATNPSGYVSKIKICETSPNFILHFQFAEQLKLLDIQQNFNIHQLTALETLHAKKLAEVKDLDLLTAEALAFNFQLDAITARRASINDKYVDIFTKIKEANIC